MIIYTLAKEKKETASRSCWDSCLDQELTKDSNVVSTKRPTHAALFI
jgi:hypothetical protein